MPEIPVSYQDQLEALAKHADQNGDCFKLKVMRRPNAASSITQHMGTFADAKWEHIANAESWIAPLFGGGLYVIQVFDGKDARRSFGTICPSEIVGAPRPLNPAIARSTSWLGPQLILSSEPQPTGVAGSILGSDPFQSTITPRTGDGAGIAALLEELRRKGEEVSQREHKLEVEGLRRESAERAARLEAQIRAMGERPASDPAQVIGAVLAAAAPIVSAFLASAGETRKAQLVLDEARISREREERAAALARPLIDPALLAIIQGSADRAAKQSEEFANLMRAQAESARTNAEGQAVAQRTMLQTIADVASLQLKLGKPDEAPGIDWGKVIAGVMQGIAAMGAQRAGQPQPQPTPPGTSPIPTPQLPAEPQAPPVPESPALNAIEDRIRAKEPPAEIVRDLAGALEDPASKAEIQAMNGIENVFSDRLDDFAGDKANDAYMGALLAELQKAGILGSAQA